MARDPVSDKGKKSNEHEPCPGQDLPVDAQTAVVVLVLDLIINFMKSYKDAMAKHVAIPNAGDLGRDDLITHYGRLEEIEALVYLATVWKESRRFVSKSDLAQAGISSCIPDDSALTRNIIGSAVEKFELERRGPSAQFAQTGANAATPSPAHPAMEDRFRSVHKFARRAGRVVHAAEIFDLIETDAERAGDNRANFKPVQATSRLDAMLRELALDFAERLYAELSMSEECTEPADSDPAGK